MSRPPLPPFTHETAVQKVRMAEDGWNSRDPGEGRRGLQRGLAGGATAPSSSPAAHEIEQFLTRKWARELDYRLIKELWAFGGDRIAVRFAYEWHDDSGQWFRSYGNENWEFDDEGLMRRRHASINDLPIAEADRLYHWPRGPPSRRPPRPQRPRPVAVALVDRLDRLQRRHPVAGFPIAVAYKYVDDSGHYLAALITYYAFISLFPAAAAPVDRAVPPAGRRTRSCSRSSSTPP